MKNSGRCGCKRPAQKPATLFTAEAQGWRKLISIFNFNFRGGEPRYFHFINVLQTTAGVEKTAEPSIIGGKYQLSNQSIS